MNNIIDFDKASATDNNQKSLPPSAEDGLKAMLTELEIVDDYNALVCNRHAIKNITRSLFDYITPIVPHDLADTSLLAVCLQKAIRYWMEYEEKTNCTQSGYIAFVKGLLEPLPVLRKYVIYVEMRRKRFIWNFMDGGLGSWWQEIQKTPNIIQRASNKRDNYEHYSDYDIRSKIMYEIMKHNDLVQLNGNIDFVIGRSCMVLK
jgi:hypothetical protein